VVKHSGRFAIAMGLCASIVCGCGVSDRPLHTISTNTDETGGASSNGGANPGGANTNGGSNATGGSITTLAGGSSGRGGSSSGGSGAGGIPVGGGGNVGGGGPDTTPSVTGPANRTAEGVSTNLSGAVFVKTTGNLVITSLYVTLEVLSSFNSIQFWGDFENRGSSLECIPNPTVAINGYDVLAIADAPAYKDTSTVSTACVVPGGTGVLSGIDNDVSATLLEQGSNVTYDFSSIVRPSAVPHPGAPTLVTAAVVNSLGSYVVSGNLRAGSVTVYNLSLNFFIRDSSGLIRDEDSAFPGDLGTITANSVLAYESYGTDAPFSRYVQFPRLIEGVASNFVFGPPSEYDTRRSLIKQRFADVAAARRIIRH
jgi:hypothetical protein